MTQSQTFTEFLHQVLKCGDSVLTCGICHSSDGFKVWGFGFKVWGFSITNGLIQRLFQPLAPPQKVSFKVWGFAPANKF